MGTDGSDTDPKTGDDNSKENSKNGQYDWTGDQVPLEYVEQLESLMEREGLDPDIKPTIRFLRKHGLSGINHYAKRNGMTIDEVLLKELGFEPKERKPLPGTDPETKQLIREFMALEKKFNVWDNEGTIPSSWTHFRKIIEISMEVLGTDDLIGLVRAPQGEQVRQLFDLLIGLEERYEQGSCINYAGTLLKFYDHIDLVNEIDDHYLEEAIGRMGWTVDRDSPDYVMEPNQIKEAFRTCGDHRFDYDENNDIPESLAMLRRQALVILFAHGLRTGEVCSLHQDQLKLDPDAADPMIVFEDRKMGPAKVPIMVGRGILEAFVEELKYTQEDWNGYLFPSSDSTTGHRCDGWIRDRWEEIMTVAGITFPNDETPTPKHGRDYFYNEFVRARRQFLGQVVNSATEAQGASSEEIADTHYLHDRESRLHFRNFAKNHFKAAFPDYDIWDAEKVREYQDLTEQSELDKWMQADMFGMMTTIQGVMRSVSHALDELRAWGQIGKDFMHPRKDLLDLHRAGEGLALWSVYVVALALVMKINAMTYNLATGEVTGPRITWVTLMFVLMLTIALLPWDFDVEDLRPTQSA